MPGPGGPGGDAREWLTIVGVVGDVRVGGVDDEVRPLVYQPAAQSRVQPRNIVVLLRGAEPPAALVASARGAVSAIDPGVPVFEAAAFDRILLDSMGPHRLAALLLGAYALAVLALAALGVYGILSYVANRSGGEFALRMALGASGRDILWVIGRRSLGLAAAGIGAGSLLAALALRLMGTQLEQPLPPAAPVLVTTAALLTVVVLAACSGPAARAARTDAADALRNA